MRIGTMTKTEGAETTTPAQAVMRMQVAVTMIATPTWMVPAMKMREMVIPPAVTMTTAAR
jgi:hypothetical protein